MPLRLALTPEQHLERIREQTRRRVKRYREKRNATGNASVAPQGTPGNVTPPTPPVSRSISKEIEKVGRLLEPLAVRGYGHDPDFWAELAASYPAARLAVEAYKIAGWFKDPAQRNRKVKSWPAFLDNWVKKAQRDETAPPLRPRVNGPVAREAVDPPIAYQKNPGPDPAPWLTGGLQTFTPEELERLAAEHARVPFRERLAAKVNGVHR